MWLRLTCNGQFHLIHSLFHLLPPKHLILGEISKIIIPGGVHWQIFWVFQLIWIILHWTGSKWPSMVSFLKKWLRLTHKSQFLSFCSFIHIFPQNEAQIDLEWPISPDSQLFPSFATKASHFWRNLKNFYSWGERVHHQIFWVFNFLNHFTLEWLKMTLNGKFCQKSGLDWLKMTNFGMQVYPSFLPKWGSDWLIMANFTRFTTFPSHFASPRSAMLIFRSKLTKNLKFSFLGEGQLICTKSFCFATFSNCFTLDWLKMTLNGNFFPKKWLRLAPNDQFWSFCRFSHLFPKMRLRLTWNGQFHLIHDSKWPTMANFSTKVAWISSKCVILSKRCLNATIKTDGNLNIWAESQWPICH